MTINTVVTLIGIIVVITLKVVTITGEPAGVLAPGVLVVGAQLGEAEVLPAVGPVFMKKHPVLDDEGTSRARLACGASEFNLVLTGSTQAQAGNKYQCLGSGDEGASERNTVLIS